MRCVATALFVVVSLALPLTAQVQLEKSLTTSPANLDMPESYRLRLSVPAGAQPLTAIGPVVDTLPPGTVFNGATPAADCQPGCVGTTPATVTWTAPCATPLNPGSSCDVTLNVTFPSSTYPSGASVTNSFTADATPSGGSPQTFGPTEVTHPVTTFVASPGVVFSKGILPDNPNPALNQPFTYWFDELANSGNVPLDNMVVIDTLPVELEVEFVETGSYSGLSDFAPGEGVRVSYEKNTAPGVFTLWGSSPNTTTGAFLSAPPPGLGAGESITRIRWEFGQAAPGMTRVAQPLIHGRIINPDNQGGPVAVGDTVQNCATLTAVYTAGPVNVSSNDCVSLTVSGPFVKLHPIKTAVTSGPFAINDAADFVLEVHNLGTSTDPMPLDGLIVSDLLPPGLSFGGWTFDALGTGLPAPQSFTQTPDFDGSGATLLQWRWNGGSGSLPTGEAVRINVAATVAAGVVAGDLTNALLVDSDAAGLDLRCSLASETDAADLDGDSDTAETLCRASSTITIASVAEVSAVASAAGVCDAAPATPTAATLPGGTIDYHLELQNDGTVVIDDLVLIDILPSVGDTNVSDATARGSQWTPSLNAPIVVPDGAVVYYSTSGNPCRGEVGGPATGCDAPGWTTVPPVPISAVRSFKIEFPGFAFAPADAIAIGFSMTAPAVLPAGSFAYDTFAYGGNTAALGPVFGESSVVGTTPGSCAAAAVGDFIWTDINGDGIQNDGPTGINGVLVQLFAAGTDGVVFSSDDVLAASTVTGDDPSGAAGWYRFPALPAGQYFARVAPPAAHRFAPRDATADGSDSDASASGVSHQVGLASVSDDGSLDFGLVPTGFGAVDGYVWHDVNGDGIQNEPVSSGLNGVTVRLYRDDGDGAIEAGASDPLVASAMSADNAYGQPGYFLFDMLEDGVPYFIEFVVPASMTNFTVTDTDAEPAVDSDAEAGGFTTIFSVAAGETITTIDAGYVAPAGTLVLGDRVWNDFGGFFDDDGIRAPSEPGIDGVRLDLYRDANGDGLPAADEYLTTTTTATMGGNAGSYRFTGLPAGDYLVVVAPSNFAAGGALAGMTTASGNDPAPDPDDDVDDDDNGVQLGALVLSQAITLTGGGEPTSEDGDASTNLTLDFGFSPGFAPAFDYGDAPDAGVGTGSGDYQTTAFSDGPRHRLAAPNAPSLGACVDGDSGILQNIGATADDGSGSCADDEDGVAIGTPFIAGGSATVELTTGEFSPCALDAWVDWNQDGDFNDAGEQIASGASVFGSATLGFAVPATALPGTTYARFRCSSAGGLTPTGEAADGEVEDHAVSVVHLDFGDAPDPTYPTLLASDGARHRVQPANNPTLGSIVDAEGDGAPGALADGDDASGADDEDGVTFAPLVPGTTGEVTLTAGSTGGFVSVWVDFDRNGSWGDAGEQVVVDAALAAGASQTFTFPVPATAVPGEAPARARIDSSGGLGVSGLADDGEVEDHLATIHTVASFTVTKDFSDDNATVVDITLVCTSGLVAPATASASEGSPAVFTVTGFSGTPACTATEAGVPAGYTPNESGCAGVALGSGGCTITNELNTASFAVAKDFSDDNTAAVEMSLVCTSGIVAPATALASEGAPAVFTVTGFSGTPSCTATEVAVPPGYVANEAACASVSLDGGGCTIVNTLTSASFSVAKDFSDDAAAAVEVSLTCTSGFVSPATASASEGAPAVFTVTGFSGTPTCTATEATVPAGYTANQSACANVALGSGGCTIVNTLNGASFIVTKDFSDNNPAAVDVSLVCTSGLVSPATAAASEGSPAVFTVTGFSGTPACTATETPLAGYTPDESACANAALASGGCTILNTLNGASFAVSKDFSDDSAGTVEVSVVCSSGLVSPASASASEGAPAVFTVSGFSGTPTCTATETPVPGYTADESACANVALASGGCTILNTLNGASFAVSKDFSDDSAGAVEVSVVCTSGLVSPASASASEGSPAVFTVSGFSGAPTCTATETPVPGYTADESACANVALASGGCTILNTLNGASFAVSKDFSDDSAGAVEVSVVCTSGLVSPASASASEGSPAVFTVSGFSGTPTCTATETPVPGYTPNESACANVALASGGCTIVNTLNTTRISIVHATSPSPDPTNTLFSYVAGGGLVPTSFTLRDGETQTFDVLPGSGYSVALEPPPGWMITGATCSNGSVPGSITIAAGENVVCTFVLAQEVNVPLLDHTGLLLMLLGIAGAGWFVLARGR